MTKPEITVRFRLIVEDVEASELGNVVAHLSQIGQTRLTHELITDVQTYKQRSAHEVKAEEFLAAWVAEHPTFKAIEAIKHFRDNGRTDGACYTALRVLCAKKILKKVAAGEYARADQKALPAPKKIERERHEVDHREFILRYARQHHGRMSAPKLRAHFDLHGRKPTSVGGALNVLVNQKMIKPLGDGEYELRAKATPEKKTKTPPPESAALPAAKSNGSAAHIEAVIHG